MTRADEFAFFDHPGPLAIAHRGGASEAPENSLRAFEFAVGLGFRYVETDVHVTRDGVLVAFHDDRLDRVTDRAGMIADLTWNEVQLARIDGAEPIPLLADLLGTFPDLRVNIDPKSDAAVEPLIEVLRHTAALDRVCVGSFSDRRVARVRRALGPRLSTSLGPIGVGRLVGLARGVPTGRLPAPAAQVPIKQGRITIVDERLVRAAHRRGLHVHVWTIDEPDEMHRLLDLGVDGIMTDRPAVLKDVLVGRGQWA